MKKYEKVLLAIFGTFFAAFLIDVLFRLGDPKVKEPDDIFDPFTRILSIPFAISVLGIITVLVNARLRSRREAGLPPISKLYSVSFWLSFIPFVLLLISSISSAFEGASFMYETFYGGEAFWLTFMLTGVMVFCWIIPVFPVLIFWQVLYIVNCIRIKRAKVK
ncbi:MAG: hypothetical protein J6M48_00580 [Ruminococcus sp.]|nr:hypothetical protein [Ruminococcus sp.]